MDDRDAKDAISKDGTSVPYTNSEKDINNCQGTQNGEGDVINNARKGRGDNGGRTPNSWSVHLHYAVTCPQP